MPHSLTPPPDRRACRRDWRTVLCVAGAGLSVTLAVFAAWYVREYHQARMRFSVASDRATQAVAQTCESRQSMVQTLRSFYDASSAVSRSEFTLATTDFRTQHPDIQAFGWVPRIRHEQRSAYETRTRQEGMERFQFTERGPDGQLARCGEKTEYYPLSYVEPYSGNATYVGFDMMSDQAMRDALIHSRDTGEPVAAYLPQLDGESGPPRLISIVVPV